MLKLYDRGRTHSWLPRVRDSGGNGSECDYKGVVQGNICGDGIVLYLDCCGNYCGNLHLS